MANGKETIIQTTAMHVRGELRGAEPRTRLVAHAACLVSGANPTGAGGRRSRGDRASRAAPRRERLQVPRRRHQCWSGIGPGLAGLAGLSRGPRCGGGGGHRCGPLQGTDGRGARRVSRARGRAGCPTASTHSGPLESPEHSPMAATSDREMLDPEVLPRLDMSMAEYREGQEPHRQPLLREAVAAGEPHAD